METRDDDSLLGCGVVNLDAAGPAQWRQPTMILYEVEATEENGMGLQVALTLDKVVFEVVTPNAHGMLQLPLGELLGAIETMTKKYGQ